MLRKTNKRNSDSKKIKAMLCGHTGSMNRGCEAIIRSTTEILSSEGFGVEAMTFDIEYDTKMKLNEVVKLIPYKRKPKYIQALSFACQKLFKNNIWGNRFYYSSLIKNSNEANLIFNVGGDTYCYTMPWLSITLNKIAEEQKIPTVFWGCSIEDEIKTNNVLRYDINRYCYIVARESLSYDIFKQSFSKGNNLFLACDPAFLLKPKETDLPGKFIIGNTVGINLSRIMITPGKLKDSYVYQNVKKLIEYIMNKTDMNVCLIPHVYNIKPEKQDFELLNKIYSEYTNNERVSIVNQDLSCEELKYIISCCRFFIGARTHSTIAAYSSEVPTIALSYSIKSRGLAKDIMGTEEGYAILWKSLKNSNDLTNYFINYLLDLESEIRERLHKLMPTYKKSIINVANQIYNDYSKKHS